MIRKVAYCFTVVSTFATQLIDDEARIVPQSWAQSHQRLDKKLEINPEMNTSGFIFGHVVSQLFHN